MLRDPGQVVRAPIESWRGDPWLSLPRNTLGPSCWHTLTGATKKCAVEVLGLRDYAELLVMLADAGIQPPRLSDEEIEQQTEAFANIWRMR